MRLSVPTVVGVATALAVVVGSDRIASREFGAIDESGSDMRLTRHGNVVKYEWTHPTLYDGPVSLWFSIDFSDGYDAMQATYAHLNHTYIEDQPSKFIRDDPFGYKGLLTAAHFVTRLEATCLSDVFARGGSGVGCDARSIAISFVQSFPYQSMGNYQRYAVETLLDGHGDCSDTAVLLAGILRYLGRDVVFLSFPDHLAVGIGEGGLLDQAVWTWQGRWYWYLETTGFGWEIGHVPDGRREAVIYPAG